jgi:hypothetical protein
MHLHRKIMAVWLLTWAAIGLRTQATAEEVGLQVEANRTQIYLGESFVLTVKVSGLDAPPDPDLAAITNCSVKFLDSQSQSFQQVTIINGRMQKTGFVGRAFTYEVTPLQAGRFTAGPIGLPVSGRTISAPGPSLDVSGVEQQSDVQVRVTASRDTVLVDEPFDVTLTVIVKRLPPPHADTDPFDPANPPKLEAPFLESRPIPGLDGPDIQEMLKQIVTDGRRQAGFAINNYTIRRDPFDSFFNFNTPNTESPALFALSRQPATREKQDVWEYTLAIRYVPKEQKTYTFGPVTFKGPLVTGGDASGQAAALRVFAVGPAHTVRVVPPPEADRPSSFTGAIGSNLTVEARLDTQACRVGDPLTLTLVVAGGINLRNAYPPSIQRQEDLARDFKVYEDTVQIQPVDSGKKYVYTIRPTRAGTLEIPPLDVSYYDVNARAYQTARTQPIPVKVDPAPQVAEDMIIAASTNETPAVTPPPVTAEGLVVAPVDMSPLGPEDQPLQIEGGHVLVLVGGPTLFLFTLAAQLVARRRRATAETRKRKAALYRALQLINEVGTVAASDPLEARRRLCDGIRRYVANRYGAAEAGLTPDDVRRILHAHGLPAEAMEQLCGVLERHYNAGFSGGATGSTHELVNDSHAIRDTLKGLERGLQALVLFFALTTGTARADSAVERWFNWDEANSRMAAARTPAGFLAAAQTYRELVNEGVRNGPLFYNLGTALLKAGQPSDALIALALAEIHMGTTPEIQRNMQIALAATDRQAGPSLPWYRLPLFWHFSLPIHARLHLAVASFGLFWLGLTLRLFRRRRAGSGCVLIGCLLMVIFGSSVAASLEEESRLLPRLMTAPTVAPALPPATHATAKGGTP